MARKKISKKKVITGRGDYSVATKGITDASKRLEAKIDHLEKSINKPASVKGAASSIGRTLGNFVNQGDLGAMAGGALAKYFGHGDYQVKSNSLMGNGKTVVPKFDGKRGTRITEREFLGDVLSGPTLTSGATDFSIRTFSLNPTNSGTFPWLSQTAHLYDQWEPNGIVFEFVSTSSEFNGTSQALGAIVMATDYDPYDVPFGSKQDMENSDYACSTKPSLGLAHGLECDPKERPTEVLYTRETNGAPLTSTSLGNFQVATKGCSTAGTVLGELWISYDITFYKKQMYNGVSGPYGFFAGGLSSAAAQPWCSGVTTTSARDVALRNTGGVGSLFTISNARVGEYYLFMYTINNYVSADAGNLMNHTPTDCVAEFNRYSNATTSVGVGIVVKYFRITGPNPTVLLDLRTAAAISTWTMDVIRTNTDDV